MPLKYLEDQVSGQRGSNFGIYFVIVLIKNTSISIRAYCAWVMKGVLGSVLFLMPAEMWQLVCTNTYHTGARAPRHDSAGPVQGCAVCGLGSSSEPLL